MAQDEYEDFLDNNDIWEEDENEETTFPPTPSPDKKKRKMTDLEDACLKWKSNLPKSDDEVVKDSSESSDESSDESSEEEDSHPFKKFCERCDGCKLRQKLSTYEALHCWTCYQCGKKESSVRIVGWHTEESIVDDSEWKVQGCTKCYPEEDFEEASKEFIYGIRHYARPVENAFCAGENELAAQHNLAMKYFNKQRKQLKTQDQKKNYNRKVITQDSQEM
jgi:hypothetical protein